MLSTITLNIAVALVILIAIVLKIALYTVVIFVTWRVCNVLWHAFCVAWLRRRFGAKRLSHQVTE